MVIDRIIEREIWKYEPALTSCQLSVLYSHHYRNSTNEESNFMNVIAKTYLPPFLLFCQGYQKILSAFENPCLFSENIAQWIFGLPQWHG